MAGIGFELRRAMRDKSLFGLFKAYGYSALLSAGPWVISILAILAVGFLSLVASHSVGDIIRFQIIVTYAFVLAATLVISGFFQLPFTRHIADLIYSGKEDRVLGTYLGVIFMTLVVGGGGYFILTYFLLPDVDLEVQILVSSIFTVLSSIWLSNTIVNSLRYFNEIVFSYFISYAIIVLGSWLFGGSLVNLLFDFLLGNSILLTIMMVMVVKRYTSDRFLIFDFFNRKTFYYSLGFAGLFYNLGTWIDKIIFWYHPLTGKAMFGNIHASVLYDIPVFLAYLSIVPGMAIFFYRLETDFADVYEQYIQDISERGTLRNILREIDDMRKIIREALREILAFQAIVDLVLFLLAPKIFAFLNLPQLYLGLLKVLTVGAMLQLGFMSVLAILFYLDKRREAMKLSILFFLLNSALTWYSITLGPIFYGYGYALSLLVSFAISLVVLNRVMSRYAYETYMLR